MLFDLPCLKRGAERVGGSTVIDVRASDTAVSRIATESTRRMAECTIFVKSQIARAKLIPRNDALNEHNRDTPKRTRVPFIVTYNPALPNIREILHKKQPILDSTERLHNIFNETPVVAFRRSPNLRDLLVRAKLKTPESSTLRHPPGTFRCNSRHGCLTCPNIDDGRTTYTFSTTGETREIKQHITCKSNNLTYMIECKKCKKQYIGETKRSLRERFTEHRQATNNSDHASASAAVPTHFNLPSHSVKDMLLIPLELQVTNNPSRRKAREAYFVQRGQTLTPYGINRRNEC